MTGILTVGHSTHGLEHFVRLLAQHGVTAVADIRSVPASRFAPQFNRAVLRRKLAVERVKYVFLGEELGARSDEPSHYVNGRVQYDRLARADGFRKGIERLSKGARTERIALMCTELEPLDCHRAVLVSKVLTEQGIPIMHLHGDGRLESHGDAMQRLMNRFGLGQPDLFHTREQLLGEALARQEQRIAYVSAAGTSNEAVNS